MRRLILASLLTLLSLASVSAGIIKPPPIATGWIVDKAKPASEQSMPLLVYLQMPGVPLAETALRVSDLSSSEYGSYLSKHHLQKLVGVPQQNREAIEGWLSRALPHVEIRWGSSGDSLHLQTNVHDVEKLFATKVVRLVSPDGAVLRAGDLQLPSEVVPLVACIFGTHGLPLPRQRRPTTAKPIYHVTPELLRQVYRMVEVNVSRSDVNRRAVAEFQNQFMDATTLKQFFERYVKGKISYEQGLDDVIYKFVGSKYQAGEGVEAILDVEYIMGPSPGVKTEFWEWHNFDFCGDLANWTEAILAHENPPLVHSISYGIQANLSTAVGCTDAQVAVVDRNFQKLAVRGITLIVASGDTGSAYQTTCSVFPGPTNAFTGTVVKQFNTTGDSDCCTECSALASCGAWDQELGSGNNWSCTLWGHDAIKITPPPSWYGNGAVRAALHPKLWPSWPASSPWVTAIGATRFIQQEPAAGEMATDLFGSGGGFSSMFASPPWQQEQVKHFFDVASKSSLPPASVYFPGGRATPDVSALGEGYQVWTPGQCNLAGEGQGYEGTILATIKNTTNFGECCQACPSVKGCRFFQQVFDDGHGQQECQFFGADAKLVTNSNVLGGTRPTAPFVQNVAGTSASTPVFAGMVSLLNEVRIAHGKPPLGFLNPWLYKNQAAFMDVTRGTNAIDRDGNPFPYGWECVPGWDPATGLGTPKFDSLLTAALSDEHLQILI